MTSAVSQVLSTPELLELILVNLSQSTLLLSKRVCSNFNNLINTSPILKEALFLSSNSGVPSNGKQWTVNPLLCENFTPFFDNSTHNPSVLKHLDWATSPQRRSAFLRSDASWRRMALTSGSSHMLQIACCIHMQDGDSYEMACMSFDETSAGVTMGAIYDIVQSWCPNHPVASFYVFVEDKEGMGKVDVTIYLEMTVQCCMDSDEEEDQVDLRSEGEEVTAKKLEWRKASKEEWVEIRDMNERRVERRLKAAAERERKEYEEKKLKRRAEKARDRGVAVEEVSDVEDEKNDDPSLWDTPDSCGGHVYPRCPCGGRYL